MKILGVLQNQWVRDPERTRALIAEKGPEYRRRLLHYALFAGCLTGRRLKAWLGDELCGQIEWEEASPEITGHSSGNPKPDPEHVRAAIERVRPDVVLAFGVNAANAVMGAMQSMHRNPAGERMEFRLICVGHPAARNEMLREQARQACLVLKAEWESSP